MKRYFELVLLHIRAVTLVGRLVWKREFRLDPGSLEVLTMTRRSLEAEQRQKAEFALTMLRAGKLLTQANIARSAPLRDS